MDGNVVPFRAREAAAPTEVTYQAWSCGGCGATTWEILTGGFFRCATCKDRCAFRWFDPRDPPPGAA